MNRRSFLALPFAICARVAFAEVAYPNVVPGRPLSFPRDHGSHPEYRTEWWYVTGWVADDAGNVYGVQVTFFRNRPGVAEANKSAFAPRQLVFAHAALADGRNARFLHDQRAARAGFGLAGADETKMRAWIDDWSLARSDSSYIAHIGAREFMFDLTFTPTQPVLLQGANGYSRKGPLPQQASYYYSEAQLAASGTLTLSGERRAVTGKAWLDHEWSSEYIPTGATGWDWVGIDLADGGALMAFRMRDRSGASFWAGASLRGADGRVHAYAPEEIRFTPLRWWRSPQTGTDYPIGLKIEVGEIALETAPLFDAQELDSRASTGTIYWEGAVRAMSAGRELGRGYLELTGYGAPLRF